MNKLQNRAPITVIPRGGGTVTKTTDERSASSISHINFKRRFKNEKESVLRKIIGLIKK
jgi:hypothetical protein